MTEASVLPTAGYKIERIYTNKLNLMVRFPAEGENGEFLFRFDWRFILDDLFEVTLGIKLEPSAARPEECEVVVLGRFRKSGETQSVPLADFAEQHAPGILMPYARMALASLTAQGFFGAYHVQPMNMRAVIAGLNMEPTGRKQISVPGAASSAPVESKMLPPARKRIAQSKKKKKKPTERPA